ncbi:MAG: hypothetical protein KAI66_22805, partial [Lentisphaeria bacterium]|nr:hypothetical protein [Lentisphaeria bacterium]
AAPGACRTTVFYRKNTPSGTYVSWAQTDADASVAESNEKNNVSKPVKLSVGTTPPKGPDLVVDSLTTKVTGSLFASVRYAARICNKGQSPTLSGTQVHIYYDRKTAPATGQHGDKFASVPALKPGSCMTAYVTRTGPPPGIYISWAQVDPDNWVKEAVETNNIAGPKNVVVGSSPGADLAIKSLTAQVYSGSSVRYQIQVCNKGTGTAGTTTVDVYFNRPNPPPLGVHGDQVTLVPQLGPGACSTRTIFRSGTPAGTYVSWAQVDVSNIVKETDEANNIGGPTKVSVGGTSNLPDLRVTSLAAKVSGSTVYYSIRVCNYGQQAATYSSLDLYYNSPFPPSAKQTGNDVIKVSPLNVSACQTINRQRTNVPQGTYLSWARTDRLNQIQESNENNNLAGPRTTTVGPTTASCYTVCLMAIQCGLFSPVAFPECNTWCSKLNPWEKSCVDKAVAKHDCNA